MPQDEEKMNPYQVLKGERTLLWPADDLHHLHAYRYATSTLTTVLE